MGAATQPSSHVQPFKILSLDDRGVDGLSSLLILENIIENIQYAEDLPDIPKPCERFDLIGGAGTGGIIAIILGRLGMSVGDFIEAYKEICSAAFTTREQKWLARLKTKSTPRISTTNLGNALKSSFRENRPLDKGIQGREGDKSTANTCQHENERFLDQECVKAVVLATTTVNIDAHPILFRTYHATASLSECKIWEAGRATSAMASLFKPIGPLTNALKESATSSKRVADELERKHHGKEERHHRFNTADGQGAIAASSWIEPSEVAAHAQNSINDKRHDIKSFAKILINGFPLVSGQPEKLAGAVPVYHIPFHENLKFVGHQNILSQLDNKLFTQAGFQQVAPVGLDGIVKTQVALKLAYTVKAKHAEYSVL